MTAATPLKCTVVPGNLLQSCAQPPICHGDSFLMEFVKFVVNPYYYLQCIMHSITGSFKVQVNFLYWLLSMCKCYHDLVSGVLMGFSFQSKNSKMRFTANNFCNMIFFKWMPPPGAPQNLICIRLP